VSIYTLVFGFMAIVCSYILFVIYNDPEASSQKVENFFLVWAASLFGLAWPLSVFLPGKFGNWVQTISIVMICVIMLLSGIYQTKVLS
jgi:hypothetical protein